MKIYEVEAKFDTMNRERFYVNAESTVQAAQRIEHKLKRAPRKYPNGRVTQVSEIGELE